MRLLALEVQAFLRERGIAAGLALIFLAGLYATEHGRRVIAVQRDVLASVPAMQGEHLQKMLAMHDTADGPGNLLYYLNFFTAHQPSRFAPVSLGLRDVQPFNLKVRMLALEGQLYDTDIQNPAALALGNFDLAFLLVLLYPLLVIAFTHNVLSAEQESGTWALVAAVSASRRISNKRASISPGSAATRSAARTWRLISDCGWKRGSWRALRAAGGRRSIRLAR